MTQKDVRRLFGLGVLAFIVLTVAAWENTSRLVDSRYRWSYEFQTVDTTDVPIRFPKKETGSNAIPAAANARSVSFLQIVNAGTQPNEDFIIISPAFPEGRDTVRVSNLVRIYELAGVQVDSIRYQGVVTTANQRIQIMVAGGKQ